MTEDITESEVDLQDQIYIPIGLGAGMGLIYLVELWLADSLSYGAAYGYLSNLPQQLDPLLRFMAPFLHSNHGHILWNLAFFLVLSALILTHVHWRDYLVMFLMASWFTASIITWLEGGGLGFGISGGNAALAGWEVVYRGRKLSQTASTVESVFSRHYLWENLLFGIPAFLTLAMLGQGLGLIDVKSGVSVIGHFSGVIFGLTFGVFWNYVKTT